jgi:hypothetical protein
VGFKHLKVSDSAAVGRFEDDMIEVGVVGNVAEAD